MIKEVDLNDKKYPPLLKKIYMPPARLFVKGDLLPLDENAVAIVGTRRATLYGLEQCERIAYDLAIRGITVVSGMARGIDSAAHRGALKARGRTIAVLGSGHNHIYPRENKELYEEIAKKGAVISEFPPDVPPFKLNFPRRNRIISGLSKGVLVVEAAQRSGALITAGFALNEGREVFALPGNINSARSSGTNALIKEGAKLVSNATDILEELGNVLNIERPEYSPGPNRPGINTDSLSLEEKSVFSILDHEPKAIDEISTITNVPVHRITDALVRLELKRLIKMLPGENFVRK